MHVIVRNNVILPDFHLMFQKQIAEQKLKAFSIGSMGAKRALTKKEQEEQKKKEQEAAAAQVCLDFSKM